MNRITILVIGLFAIFGIWLWTKISTAQKLVYKLLTPENISFSGLKINWNQPVQITNPTNTGIYLKLIQFDVFNKNVVVGSGFYNQPLTISSASQTVVKVPCSIGILELLLAVPNLITEARSQNLKFLFQGNINAEGFTVGVQTDISIPIPNLSFLRGNSLVNTV